MVNLDEAKKLADGRKLPSLLIIELNLEETELRRTEVVKIMQFKQIIKICRLKKCFYAQIFAAVQLLEF